MMPLLATGPQEIWWFRAAQLKTKHNSGQGWMHVLDNAELFRGVSRPTGCEL